MPKLVSERQETSGRNSRDQKRTARKCTGEMEGEPPTKNGGSNDCRKFWTSLMCGSQDLTLHAIMAYGVCTVRQTLRRMFSAMAAERGRKRRKLGLTPVNNNHRVPAL